MMECYLDESGIHDGAKVCVVAGFYGEQQAWRDFEDDWNTVLGDYPELIGEGFHAKRFYARQQGKRVGRYKDWTNEKAGKFIERLTVCIESAKSVFPIGYAVLVDDFMARPLISRQWFTGAKFEKPTGKVLTSGCPNKPYYLPFSFCVLKSAQKSSTAPNEKLHVFVGLDRTFQGYAASLYKFFLVDDRLSESLRSKLGTLANPLAKDTPGLQAADLLAYTMYNASLIAVTLIAQKKAYNPPAFLMRLLKNWEGEPTVKLMSTEFMDAVENAGAAEYEKLRAGGMLPK